MGLIVFAAFGLWAIGELLAFVGFLLRLQKLLRHLEVLHPAKWTWLTTHERLAWGPGTYVWSKCRRFLRDESDDLGDKTVLILKRQTSRAYCLFVRCSLLGPIALVVLFAILLGLQGAR